MPRNMLQIRELGEDEIARKVGERREELFKLRWQAAGGQADNPRRIRELRREIARHLTVLRERERSAAKGEKS